MKRISREHIEQRCDALLAERGLSPEHRRAVINCLLHASLSGIDTHGIRLLPTYLRLLDSGRANGSALPRIPPTSQATARIDAQGALGPVAGHIACEWLVQSARTHGIAAVGIYNSNHFGAAGYYSQLLAKGVGLGIACCNSDALVVPVGGSVPLFGTNPLSIAADAGDERYFNLDMATSQTSFSRLLHHKARGTALDDGWAVDQHGTPTLEASAAAWLLPLGGYKGQGLGMAVEILAAILTGADFDHELHHVFDPVPQPASHGVGHFFIAIDVSRFLPREVFANQLVRLMDVVGQQDIRVDGCTAQSPGDKERAFSVERNAMGIPVLAEWKYFYDLPAACSP